MLIQALLAFQQQVLINYYTWTSLKQIMYIHLRIKVFISIIAVLLPSLKVSSRVKNSSFFEIFNF